MTMFDDKEITITCPRCDQKITKPMNMLRASPDIKCPGCETNIKIDGSGLDAGLTGAERQIEKFKKKVGTIKIKL